MSDFDRDRFREQVKTRLRQLHNRKLSVAFAVRMALLALPLLTDRAEEEGFLWYWPADKREKHLLAVYRALQSTYTYIATDDYDTTAAADADAAYADAYAVRAAAYAAYAAYAAADTAAYAAADADAYAAAAADAAADAYADTAAVGFLLTEIIKKELHDVEMCSNVRAYLTGKIALPSSLVPAKDTFLIELRKLPEFDYWAEWFQDRYDGKAFDVELLTKSVLLPAEVQAQSPREINRYLKQLRDGTLKEKIKRVRAIFIGNGDAGKTTLVQALNNQAVTEGSTDMTPGIEISEWPVADSDLTAHFWDFGGQVIAHATHQFFLRARCVYVLVLNARSVDSNPNQQAEYWLEYIRAFGDDAPVLLVGNKCDLVPVLLDVNRLKETYSNICGFYPLSATHYHNSHSHEFAIFKKALCEQLRKVGEVQPYFTKTSFPIVEALREKSRKDPFLKKITFDRLCKDNGIGKETRDSLLDLLDKLGEIIHFPELAWLDEYLLNPRWLTYGVYPLLYSERLKKQHGCLCENDVAAILKNHKVTDNQGHVLHYPAKKQYLLIHAMKQFKLCYPASIDGQENKWIVPDLLSSDQPATLQFNKRDALRFDFAFTTFLPRHVLSMFIVEHYRDIWHHQVWQHGVHLCSNSYQNTKALVRANYQSRVLSIEVTGDHIDHYFAVLYHSVLKILERMPKLQYAKWLYLDEKARISGRPFALVGQQEAKADFEDLLALEVAGENKYQCKFGTYNLKEVLKPMPKRPAPLPSQPPKNNPWTSGSFYLVAFVVIAAVLGGLAYFVSVWLPIIVICIVTVHVIIITPQLLNDDKLKESNFLKLMLEYYKRLFMLRK